MNKILMTGASSYVGARIYFDLKDKYDIVGTYFNNPLSKSFIKLNLTDKEAVKKIFKDIKPEIVIHIANFPSPKNAVNNEKNYIALNDKATQYLVENANNVGVKVIFTSSLAAENPDNIYGKLKLKSEGIIKGIKNGYLILRPSMIVGFSPNTANDRPFNRILRCLDDKTKIAQFDTSWKLQPTYVGHLSQVIDKVIQNNTWNKTIPVFIDEIVSQYQIAYDILSQFDVVVNPIDLKRDIPPSNDDLSYFLSLNLAPKSYKEMINVIVEEIKNRGKFKL